MVYLIQIIRNVLLNEGCDGSAKYNGILRLSYHFNLSIWCYTDTTALAHTGISDIKLCLNGCSVTSLPRHYHLLSVNQTSVHGMCNEGTVLYRRWRGTNHRVHMNSMHGFTFKVRALVHVHVPHISLGLN